MTRLDVTLMFRNGFKPGLIFKMFCRCPPAVREPYVDVPKLVIELISFPTRLLTTKSLPFSQQYFGQVKYGKESDPAQQV